jgi:hypothetical protein
MKKTKTLGLVIFTCFLVIMLVHCIPRWQLISWANEEFDGDGFKSLNSTIDSFRNVGELSCIYDNGLTKSEHAVISRNNLYFPSLKINEQQTLKGGSQLLSFKPYATLLISGPIIDKPENVQEIEKLINDWNYQQLSKTTFSETTEIFIYTSIQSRLENLSLFDDPNILIHKILLLAYKAGLVPDKTSQIIVYSNNGKHTIYHILTSETEENIGLIHFINSSDERYQLTYKGLKQEVVDCILKQLSEFA